METREVGDKIEKASTQQKAGPPDFRLSNPRERKRHNADGYKSGGQYVAVLFGLQLPLTHILSNKVRGIFFLRTVSLVFIASLSLCRCVLHESAYEYTATLRITRYRSRVKWSNPEEGVAPSPTPRCSSYWKRNLRVTSRLRSPTLLIIGSKNRKIKFPKTVFIERRTLVKML